MIPELRDLSYESHLLQCGLTTLETRRLRGDQIEVFKIVNGYENVDSVSLDFISLTSYRCVCICTNKHFDMSHIFCSMHNI